jgi:hypothetical protein
MIRVRCLILILVAVLAAACADTGPGQSTKNLPDNPENRAVVAKRYLEAMPPKEMLQGVAARIVPNLPEKDRKAFMEVMTSEAIEKAAYRITLDSLVKHFTVAELNAMVAFYGSPDGKSAYKKFDAHMKDTIPQIQQEVRKAAEAAQKQAEPQEQPKPKAQPEAPGPKEQKSPPSKN